MDPKLTQNGLKMDIKWVYLKWVLNGPEMDLKWT